MRFRPLRGHSYRRLTAGTQSVHHLRYDAERLNEVLSRPGRHLCATGINRKSRSNYENRTFFPGVNSYVAGKPMLFFNKVAVSPT
jgi:hypothetical protein